MTSIMCKVVSVEPIFDDVFNIELAPIQPVSFIAGQYLKLVMGDNDKRPFSIASSPVQTNTLQLHIGAPENNDYARQAVEKLQTHQEVEIEMPFGEAGFNEQSSRPLIIMVGGTGFSYAKSIVEYIFARGLKREIHLYWGGRNMGGLYLSDLAHQWHEQGLLNFVPVLEHAVPQWQGKRGLVHEAVLEDFSDLSHVDVYIAGRFEMAAVARDAFFAKGLVPTQLFGDAYAFI